MREKRHMVLGSLSPLSLSLLISPLLPLLSSSFLLSPSILLSETRSSSFPSRKKYHITIDEQTITSFDSLDEENIGDGLLIVQSRELSLSFIRFFFNMQSISSDTPLYTIQFISFNIFLYRYLYFTAFHLFLITQVS